MNQFAKVVISGTIELESGLHIGGSSAFAAIGAIDSPVIKDPLTNLPIIPGSSIKGKMRSLLAKAWNPQIAQSPNNDVARITRLFGATAGGGEKGDQIIKGRLLFRDAFLKNKDELQARGVRTYTEAKFENTIDRYSAMAKPRQIERAIKGSLFDFELIYEVDNRNDLMEDYETITQGLRLLELDYLGGSGSRGYGKITFKNMQAETAFGELEINDLNKLLEG